MKSFVDAIAVIKNAEAYIQRCSCKKVFWKCAANLQETPMAKCDSNKVAKQLYWNRTSAWGFSCKFTSYFQKTFSKEHIWKVRDSNLLRNEKSRRNTNKTFTSKSRSSHPDLFCKKGVLANFAEFSGKQLCQSCKLQLY